MLIRCRDDRAEVSDFLRQWQTERTFPRMRWVKRRRRWDAQHVHRGRGKEVGQACS